MYDDNEALPEEKLLKGRLTLRPVVTLNSGQTVNLENLVVPPFGEYLKDVQYEDSMRTWMDKQVEDSIFSSFRKTGVHHFQVIVIS